MQGEEKRISYQSLKKNRKKIDSITVDLPAITDKIVGKLN